MLRILLHPITGASLAAIVLAHLGVMFLPATVHGLPTPLVMLGGATGAIVGAIRYL